MNNIDVAIITPVEVEYSVLRKLLTGRSLEKGDSGQRYEVGTLTNKHLPLTAAITLGASKTTDIALVTKNVIDDLAPRLLVLAGIAGGVKDVKIGDVVVGTKAYGYESGKESATGFLSRPEVLTFSHDLVEYARTIPRSDRWNHRKNSRAMKVFFGPIASGDKLIATTSGRVSARLRTHYNDTIALEMEAIGFAKAAQSRHGFLTMNVRGISDLLNDKSNTDREGGQLVALENLAVFLAELLSQIDLREFGGLTLNDTNSVEPKKTAERGSKNTINNSTINVGGNFNLGDRK